MRFSVLMESPSHIESDKAPTKVAVQKLIKIVSLEPIFESAIKRAMSPMPNPTMPLNINHIDASGWKL